jgi:hypothetical protein
LRFEKASDVELGRRGENKDSSSSSFLESDKESTHAPLPAVKADRGVKERDWARTASPANAGITATTTTTVSVSARRGEDDEDDTHLFEGMPPRRCSRTSTLVNS